MVSIVVGRLLSSCTAKWAIMLLVLGSYHSEEVFTFLFNYMGIYAFGSRLLSQSRSFCLLVQLYGQSVPRNALLSHNGELEK